MIETSRNALRSLRETHEDRVLGLLRHHGALSRAELARRMDLSRATLSTMVGRLLAGNAVVETDAAGSSARGRGRPPTLLTLNPAGGLALGVDLGHQRTHVSIANVAHDIIATATATCTESTPLPERVREALALVDTLCARNHISLDALKGVGVGIIGPVAETGVVHSGANTAQIGADQADLVHRAVIDHLGVPAHVDNNTRLGALAEAIWGAGAGSSNVVYVRMSYGVGGGLVLDGHLFSGAFGGAAEIGHVSVDPDGPPCTCGGRGCLERYASIDAILERCLARDLDDLFDRLNDGDQQVHDAIQDTGRRLGWVIAAACNVVNPEVVVVGGELAGAGAALLEPARQAIDTYAHRQVRDRLTIRAAELADAGTALGGIALVLRRSELIAGYPAAPGSPRSDDVQRKTLDATGGVERDHELG